MAASKGKSTTKKTGGGTAFGPKGTKVPAKFAGKSTKLGSGGRAAKMKAAGVPGGVIGNIARAKGAAPGGPNYKGKKAPAKKVPAKSVAKKAPPKKSGK